MSSRYVTYTWGQLVRYEVFETTEFPLLFVSSNFAGVWGLGVQPTERIVTVVLKINLWFYVRYIKRQREEGFGKGTSLSCAS